jgi:pyocin large subunit-like protein
MVPVATPAVSSSRGFGSPSKLTEHYQKHGAEFDARSQDDYLRMAQALRDKPTPGDVLELKRDDGVICRFDRGSGAFIAFNADGTIRTFFKPNDGENYYRRQAKR